MDPAQNPFAPGAGFQPPELAGRSKVLNGADIAVQRVMKCQPSRGKLLLGLRGVGKTVLINRIYQKAHDAGAQTIRIEAPEGGNLARLIIPQIRRTIFDLDLLQRAGNYLRNAKSALRNFASIFHVSYEGLDFGVTASPGTADSGDLTVDLPELLLVVARAAKERDTAMILFIDEVQYLRSDELSALVLASHLSSQDGLPLLIFGAGLPQVAALVGNAKSYAERLFDYPEIGPLDDRAADAAIRKPCAVLGLEFHDAALAEIRAITQNYPYFLQEWGSHIWNYVSQDPVKAGDVQAVSPTVIRHLDENFFRVRFDRLTPLQQKYLRAMAELGPGPYKTGEIAAALECDPKSVAPTRGQLIKLGMVWSQRHGETSFTVPMFDEYMRRQMPKLEPHVPKPRSKG
ncbi:MAG: AAA family ATPase [Pseudomonadota bacterium]